MYFSVLALQGAGQGVQQQKATRKDQNCEFLQGIIAKKIVV
jgi:hypothetical protein